MGKPVRSSSIPPPPPPPLPEDDNHLDLDVAYGDVANSYSNNYIADDQSVEAQHVVYSFHEEGGDKDRGSGKGSSSAGRKRWICLMLTVVSLLAIITALGVVYGKQVQQRKQGTATLAEANQSIVAPDAGNEDEESTALAVPEEDVYETPTADVDEDEVETTEADEVETTETTEADEVETTETAEADEVDEVETTETTEVDEVVTTEITEVDAPETETGEVGTAPPGGDAVVALPVITTESEGETGDGFGTGAPTEGTDAPTRWTPPWAQNTWAPTDGTTWAQTRWTNNGNRWWESTSAATSAPTMLAFDADNVGSD